MATQKNVKGKSRREFLARAGAGAAAAATFGTVTLGAKEVRAQAFARRHRPDDHRAVGIYGRISEVREGTERRGSRGLRSGGRRCAGNETQVVAGHEASAALGMVTSIQRRQLTSLDASMDYCTLMRRKCA